MAQTGQHNRTTSDGTDCQPGEHSTVDELGTIDLQDQEREPTTQSAASVVLLYPVSPAAGTQYPLTADTVTLGRDDSCDIIVNLGSVSRVHASISWDDKAASFRLLDLGSTNGTRLNGDSVAQGRLKDGDHIRCGHAIFKVLSGHGVETAFHEALFALTVRDPLTEAYNKRFMDEYLVRELARCRRKGRPLSLIMLDIDHFKSINDEHGHLMGDDVLRDLTRRIQQRIRQEEVLVRYGGEEFVVVLPETDLEGATTLAERLRMAVQGTPFTFAQTKIQVSISCGVATTVDRSAEPDQMIHVADQKLYQAKRQGRNRVIA